MAVSGLQRLTVAAVVLCAALILPRILLRRESPDDPAPGRFPPMIHRHVTPDLRGQRSAAVRGQGEVRGTGSGGSGAGSGTAGTGSGPGGKSNLAAQIIPVYGFGILLYILYILFKITSKGHSKPSQSRLHLLRSENNKRKITDFELSQLQERLRETELVMENLVNTTLQEEDTPVSVSLDQEQSLLQQLMEITRAMKSNHLVQDFTSTNTFSTTTTPEETDPLDDFDPFWNHCSCHCPQTHEEDVALEDQQMFFCRADQETAEEQPQRERELQPKTRERLYPEENHQTAAGEQEESGGNEVHLEKREAAMEEQPQTERELQPKIDQNTTVEAEDTQLSEDCPSETTLMEEEHVYGDMFSKEVQTKPEEGSQEEHQTSAAEDTTLEGKHREETEQSNPVQQQNGGEASQNIHPEVPQTSEEMVPQTSEEMVPQTSEEMVPLTSEEMVPQTSEEMFSQTPEEMFSQTSEEMVPQTSEEMVSQSAEEKVNPGRREASSGVRRRNRRRRGRRL